MLSEVPERETLDWAVELNLYFNVLSKAVPVDDDGRAPLTVLLFRNDASLAPLKPSIPGRVVAGVAFFPRTTTAAMIAMSPHANPTATRRMIYHEGMHWLMGRFGGINPL